MIKFKTGKIFIHIPKTSGTNFRKNVHLSRKPHRYRDYDMCEDYINEIMTPEGKELIDILFENRINQDHMKKYDLRLVRHLPIGVWEKYGIYTDERVYTIVRNPYTRLVSIYEETIAKMNMLFNFEKPDLEKFIFSEKINILTDCYIINHKKSQTSYLKNLNGDIICEKYYKMEEDQEIIKKDFLLKDEEELETSEISSILLENIENRFSNNTREYNKDYASIFTDRLIEWTQETFKEDFEYFSYNKEPFWK